MSPQDAATERPSITIPAPELYGDGAASLLRGTAGKLRDNSPFVSLSVREAVAQLCEDAAAALDAPPVADTGYADLDSELLKLAEHLGYPLAARIRQLVAADPVAHRVIDAEQRAQRAEDLAAECRRQLRARDRQVDEAHAALAECRKPGSVTQDVAPGETAEVRGPARIHVYPSEGVTTYLPVMPVDVRRSS